MSNQSIVRLHAQVTISPTDWERFTQMVNEVKKIVQQEGSENVLTHVTYHQADSYECLIIEAYKDEAAFLSHLEAIKPLSEKYTVDWTVNRMELSGSYSESTVAFMKGVSQGGDFVFYNHQL
ncbi:hypothetical protein GO755_27725 [Spirosoma sp. HMF4905]|uniref:ABM domain-containing protein n=1 Tax=Spirosoma arboris TaxID=2682092 RepID=A0A7K1SJ66_9BACT|nr:hypothetical protein [Spirosoma arboris]MVM33857.1 hypothetical protein [Spirosoma arboris]